MPAEIGLCLFRVLQEALYNAAKHSGVKRIEVDLHEEASEIHLIVRDSGRGFDVEAVKQGTRTDTVSFERGSASRAALVKECKRPGFGN